MNPKNIKEIHGKLNLLAELTYKVQNSDKEW